jgi:hypothetical protein
LLQCVSSRDSVYRSCLSALCKGYVNSIFADPVPVCFWASGSAFGSVSHIVILRFSWYRYRTLLDIIGIVLYRYCILLFVPPPHLVDYTVLFL